MPWARSVRKKPAEEASLSVSLTPLPEAEYVSLLSSTGRACHSVRLVTVSPEASLLVCSKSVSAPVLTGPICSREISPTALGPIPMRI